MPSLVMRAPAGSLLEQSNRFVVQRQIEYGAELGLPWGVSESAYNARDLELTYQYSSFGVPGLGLKRGLGQTPLSLHTQRRWRRWSTRKPRRETSRGLPPRVAAAGMAGMRLWTTLRRASRGREGGDRPFLHGAPSRDDVGQRSPTRSRMVRCAPAFTPSRLSRRPNFCCRNEFRGMCWLLIRGADEVAAAANVRELVPPMPRRFQSPHQPVPRTHLLSNGRYAVMITAAGSGYSRWRDLAVTRWREDATCDSWGSYIFLRDAHSGDVWSAGYQPTGVEPDSYEATFFEDRAEIVRRDRLIETKMEISSVARGRRRGSPQSRSPISEPGCGRSS